MARSCVWVVLISVLAGCDSPAPIMTTGPRDAGPPPANACADWDPRAQNLLWGDLHVHTNVSFDAYYFNALNGPREAYQFARGGTAASVCEDFDVSCGDRRLTRPLDFVAVTDHAEFLGAFASVCETNEVLCTTIGNFIRANIATLVGGRTPIDADTLNRLLRVDRAPIWDEMRAQADGAYQPCELTTFHAYEYGPMINGSMMHRNVLFLGTSPPDVSDFFTFPTEWELFDNLEASCGQRDDCDYITIPHNMNLSDGRMFLPGDLAGRGGAPMTPADARVRANADVLFEMVQHKGTSECMPGGGFDSLDGEEVDSACRFEALRTVCADPETDPPNCVPPANHRCVTITGDPAGSTEPEDCTLPNDMMRGALTEGLAIERELGVNPYRAGFAGATDTHNGTPGAVDETTFEGHGGVLDNDPAEQLGSWACAPDDPSCGAAEFDPFAYGLAPGGLTAVWATQNTREAIFEAFRARRTYATSGPRIRVRAYAMRAGAPSGLCGQLMAGLAPIEEGLIDGVPMGAILPAGSAAPTIVAWAAQDTGDAMPGAPLERIQVIKGWLDAAGGRHARVSDIAGAANGPMPNADCSIERAGRPEQLCGVWTDPDFDPGEPSWYYVRVLEQTTCRWSEWACSRAGIECSTLDPVTGRFAAGSGDEGYEGCCNLLEQPDGTIRAVDRFDTIQERAWTSPFWHQPPS